MVVPGAPVRIPSQWAIPRVSRQSRLSANDKSDEMIPEELNRSTGIYLTAEENSGKLQLGINTFKYNVYV